MLKRWNFLKTGFYEGINVALDEYEIDGGEEEMILAREVNLDGRNTCRVNGRIVPLRLLSTLAERLVDIHGQSQHLSLFRGKCKTPSPT